MNSAEEMKNFYSRCLLCTCRPDVTPHLNIFSEAGSQLQIPEKIGKYLNIQIVSELPQNVCHSCMEKLEVTHELVTSSQQASITLLQIKQQIEILDQDVKQEISDCSVPELDTYQPTTDSAANCNENSTNSVLYGVHMHDSVSNCLVGDFDQSANNVATQFAEEPTHISDCTITPVSFIKGDLERNIINLTLL